MNYLIRPKRKSLSPLILAGLLWPTLSPKANAVVPAPDGGYPGGNTAEGQAALLSLTTGGFNTAVGFFSLRSNTQGSFNTAIGAGTLLAATGGGEANTATGAGALLSNTLGSTNTANGAFALFGNTEGSANTANGGNALMRNTTGNLNTATGIDALAFNTTGNNNTATGSFALEFSTAGSNNTAAGFQALTSNTKGSGNTGIGWNALAINTTGTLNTVIGFNALHNNTVGGSNIAIGASAGANVTTANGVICINASGENVNDSCYIGNIWNQPGGSQAVYVNGLGKLGAQVSSRRFKDEIKPMQRASEAIYSLRPVSFRYKSEVEPTRPLGFGLIAEEVAEISPDLVTRAGDGQVNSGRYDAVKAMLLNEFLKEHHRVEDQNRKLQEQEAMISELKSNVAQQQKQFQSVMAQQRTEMEALTTHVKEQDSKIQRVSDQLDVSKSAAQVVVNNQ